MVDARPCLTIRRRDYGGCKALSDYTQGMLVNNIVPPPRPLLCRRYKPTKK